MLYKDLIIQLTISQDLGQTNKYNLITQFTTNVFCLHSLKTKYVIMYNELKWKQVIIINEIVLIKKYWPTNCFEGVIIYNIFFVCPYF